ncbi:MarR family winged helix-turn-helix transcriptional regulator [Rhodococcus opacus]|uniref:MarR family winged helix-turn-helix transcriptional regulator n=1 Tax=Rhodococcus opacus TaxID=37919 RepID=UPI001C47697F|nr:MarR family transcriptional regulator [Rhodococcus opacus]MBV6755000.1 MarR family transcriptional regulator [Rhodococcus opacus]
MSEPIDEALEKARVLGAIEFQSAVLVRNLEMIRRRGDLYVEVDRAGYLLLRMLDARGPMDISALAGALGLDPSTTGRQVNAVQKAGFVERTTATTDRRRSVIALTDRGIDAMDAVRRRRLDGTAEMLDEWSEADLQQLATLFSRYNAAIVQLYLSSEREPSADRGAHGDRGGAASGS